MTDQGNVKFKKKFDESDFRRIFIDLKQMKSFAEDPIIFNKADGVRLWDINGKEYLDAISGIFVASVGHGNKRVISAVYEQMQKLTFAPPLHSISDTTLELARKIRSITPDSLDGIKFFSGGSESTEAAMKLIRQYHKQTGNSSKYKFISVYTAYHGATMGAMSVSGIPGTRKAKFGPFLTGFPKIFPPNCFRCPYEKEYPSCGCYCAKMLDSMIIMEGPETVAGFFLEPISNTGGIIVPPQEYFSIIRDICNKHNVMLIFDEVITGFGRTGNWFAAQTFDAKPDVICSGKGLGGGYVPIMGIYFHNKIADAFWGEENVKFSHGHTYGGNPVAAAAAYAVISEIEEKNLLENARKLGKYLYDQLQERLVPFGIVGDIRGKGLLIGIEFVKNLKTKEPFPAERNFGKEIEKRALKNGLILRCDPNWIAFGPPLISTESDVDEMMDHFTTSVKEELEAKGI